MSIPPVDYEGIFNSGSALYLILAPDAPRFTILGASDIYLQATMRTREDIVGKGVFEAFPPNPADENGDMEKTFRAAFERVMSTKKTDIMPVQQYDIPKPGGGFEIRYWSVTHSPILDKSGRLTQMAQRVEDDTELVRLQEHGDKMATEVSLRARELKAANNQLTHLNDDLEAFSYSVSHDLRAPLRSMMGFSDVLLSEHASSLSSEGQNCLHRIINAAKRMNLLIDGLLNLARISREPFVPEKVDLSALAGEHRDQLLSSDKTRKVEFTIHPRLTATGDPRLLNLVLQNLIGNAWKFTGKVENARIEFGSLTHQNQTAFFVKDNGAGFDMEYADKLFVPFQRLHSEKEFSGTGIGLTTIYKIISRHNGKIWAESEVGKGATFYFTLPK